MNPLRAIIITGVVMVFVSAPYLTFSQEKPPPSSTGQMKSMGKMSMDDMMKQCSEHHQAMTKSVDQMSKTLEAAKQSNDPGKMRAAIDQTQKHLSEMKEHMSKCENMMSMMEKMEGMGGMMKSKSK
jgi:Mg2+ and Co2+ transporter CorA